MEVTPLPELDALRQRVAELEAALGCRNTAAPPELLERRWRIVDTALSHSPDSTYIFDPDGCLLYANKTLLNLWGKPLHEVVGRSFHQLGYPPDVGRRVHAQVREVAESREAIRDQVSLAAFTGTLRHYEYIFVLVFAADESVEAIAGSTRDVTERQAEELAHINADLEHFAYAAAHDLQEPIRMVAIFSQLLEKKYAAKLDDDGRRYIAHAVAGANRMERLVRDLLAYNRASSRHGVSRELVNAEEILKEVLGDMRSTVERAGAQIHFSALPLVLMDKVHLSQLFQNLIGNAIKYRSKDVPRIHISAVPCGEMARFSVEDNGIGIEPEYADQVFGLFKRLHTNDEYEGTGIGLAICQKLVHRYGGRIWLESKPGYGSAFYFTVPA